MLNFGALTDPADDTAATYQVFWGDGPTPQALPASATSVGHIYETAGIKDIWVAVVDEDGTHVGAGFHSVNILGPAMGINFVGGGGVSGVTPGSSVTGLAGFIPQRNWNNVADNSGLASGGQQSGSAANLVDSAGKTTTADDQCVIQWVIIFAFN